MPRRLALWPAEPQNWLFDAGLFSLGLGSSTPVAVQLAYGVWMFGVVLRWDLGIARAAGHPPVVKRFMAHVRKVERTTGVILLSLVAGMPGRSACKNSL
jgi:hypothetical protein